MFGMDWPMILVACISCGPITINFRDGCYDLLLIYYNTITGRDQFGTKTSKITNHQYQFGTDTNIYCKNDLFSVRDREFRDRDCHVWFQARFCKLYSGECKIQNLELLSTLVILYASAFSWHLWEGLELVRLEAVGGGRDSTPLHIMS